MHASESQYMDLTLKHTATDIDKKYLFSYIREVMF